MARIPIPSCTLSVTSATSPDGKEHVVISSESLGTIPLVRIHSECLTGDVFGSLRCDCGEQLRVALEAIRDSGGLIIYLRQEGRGIGLAAKLRAYDLQDQGYDTVDANRRLGYADDARTYDDAVAILKGLSISQVRLLTNNPQKVQSLRDAGIEVAEVVPCVTAPTEHNRLYLAAKKERMGHLI
jgi:GTP cyclohydrolase II